MLSGQDKGVIDSFKAKAREFWSLWGTLNSKAAVVDKAPPELQKEYDDVMNRGLSVRGTIEKVTGLIDAGGRRISEARDWIKGKIGLDGVAMVPGLGALPLIFGAATIAVSLAAIGKWMLDARKLNKKLAVFEKLQRKGMSAGAASKVVDRMFKSGSFLGTTMKFGAPLILIAIVGFIYFKKGK